MTSLPSTDRERSRLIALKAQQDDGSVYRGIPGDLRLNGSCGRHDKTALEFVGTPNREESQ